ncbi:PREDICTED: cytochrome P450 4C1-like [Nicrophorus vespilloides]|uniref:Cytochrome P450 4C1-like n=1 Tax=Nicrophorus vespilloides TaxID=110193 RepID=A0ABM1MYD2_NICVS|nr:PREDICTED: cytochrome P450 4C1-like [Nicrophorus vespilloides]
MVSYYHYVIVALAVISATLLAIFLFSRRRLYLLSYALPGPTTLIPLVGNLGSFFMHRKNVFQFFDRIVAKFPQTFRFWFGPKLIVVSSDPAVLDKISKSAAFEYVDVFDSNQKETDERWRMHKKLIRPLINVKFAIDNIATFQEHGRICTTLLEKHLNNKEFDVHQYLFPCFLDIYGEILCGKVIGCQNGRNRNLIWAMETVLKLRDIERAFRWLHLWSLYKMTDHYKQSNDAREMLSYFIQNVIRKSWQRRKLDVFGENKTGATPLVDRIAEFVENNRKAMRNEEFRDYLLKIYIEASSTSALIASYVCVCFGMYPECQVRAATEIRANLGEDLQNLKYENLYKLKYLEMCILEATRLVPKSCFTIRTFTESVDLGDDVTLPEDCPILIPNYWMNRSESYQKPDHFYPNNFLPENVKWRKSGNESHGSGTHECIGRLLSMVGLKIIISQIVSRYRIEADGKFHDLRIGNPSYPKPSLHGFSLCLRD